MNAIFSKLKDIVGLGDPVEYEYEYDEVGNGDYQNMYRDNQGITPAVSTTAEAAPSPRRSRSPLAQSNTATSGLSTGRSADGKSGSSSVGSNVIGMPGAAGNFSEVMVMEPRSFEEMPQAIQALRERKSVVLNLTLMDPDQAQRSVDFIAGGTYALDGHQERIGESIFLFTPNCVQVSTQSGLVREVLQAQARQNAASGGAPVWASDRFQQSVAQ
ncbi:MAG: cell division protein SepF [Cyanobacteria bacterium P01_D01_bin.73]